MQMESLMFQGKCLQGLPLEQ
uniref:Uncharacterized protein n=1 Tax=Anguilla anguilla TaxID=7936 RepID=A0A0E9T6B8_ANGAN